MSFELKFDAPSSVARKPRARANIAAIAALSRAKAGGHVAKRKAVSVSAPGKTAQAEPEPEPKRRKREPKTRAAPAASVVEKQPRRERLPTAAPLTEKEKKKLERRAARHAARAAKAEAEGVKAPGVDKASVAFAGSRCVWRGGERLWGKLGPVGCVGGRERRVGRSWRV